MMVETMSTEKNACGPKVLEGALSTFIKGVIGPLSRARAEISCDKRTVNKDEMCHGYTLCQDGTDLEQCSALACDTSRYLASPRQSSCGTLGNTAHRECYQTSKGNDGSYDCLNRRDEKRVYVISMEVSSN